MIRQLRNLLLLYTDQVYHCWSCGAKGDVIGLVMELFGIGFEPALIQSACIPLPLAPLPG